MDHVYCRWKFAKNLFLILNGAHVKNSHASDALGHKRPNYYAVYRTLSEEKAMIPWVLLTTTVKWHEYWQNVYAWIDKISWHVSGIDSFPLAVIVKNLKKNMPLNLFNSVFFNSPICLKVISLYACFNDNTLGKLWTSSMPYLFPFIVEYRWCNTSAA
jgi:Otopetrin